MCWVPSELAYWVPTPEAGGGFVPPRSSIDSIHEAYGAGDGVSFIHGWFLPGPKFAGRAKLGDGADGFYTAIVRDESHHIVPVQIIRHLRDTVDWMDDAIFDSFMKGEWNRVMIPDIYHTAIHNGWNGFDRYNQLFMSRIQSLDRIPTYQDVIEIGEQMILEFHLARWMK